ncbi:MAG: hypothetical protein KDB03_18245 [Planctomycetales bacterium]|nr:hypothetical protein [Planctomycetales bacterium]
MLWLVAWIMICGLSEAQGPGGGAPDNAPAFSEPKFKDRVWEVGGPRLNNLSKGKVIHEVRILGNQAVSDHKIMSFMQTRPDRRFDEKQLQQDIHELYRTDLFRNIKVYDPVDSPQGVIIVLEVVEQPLVTEVVFHGNTRIDDGMLKKHCGIETGDPVNPFSVDMAKQRMLDLYHEKGFNHAAITVREGDKAGDRRVFFDISEGPLARIWQIDFEGNQVFSTAILKTKIKSRDSKGGLLRYAFNVANMNTIQADKEILVAYYRSLGYFQARVDERIKYYPDGDLLDLTFVVNEGPQFTVSNVAITGNQFFPTELLMESLEIKAGEPFNLGRMNRSVRTLRNKFYGREGFVFVDIVSQPQFLDEPATLALVFKITEGDRYRAGEIEVHINGDNSHTQQQVVLNLLGIREGEFIDLEEFENSERRLQASQLFITNPALGEPPQIKVRSMDGFDENF